MKEDIALDPSAVASPRFRAYTVLKLKLLVMAVPVHKQY